jgi:ATP diphosphatase
MTTLKPSRDVAVLVAIMKTLREPGGCPWDRDQSFATIAPYTIEEAYEVASAIEDQDFKSLPGELGDLLFQVVFHAQLADERGAWDFDAVAAGIAAKLEHRHPHVFAPDGRDVSHWEQIKAEERAARGAGGVVDEVPVTLPALTRAMKLGKRAAMVGFDWPDAAGPRAKLLEELAEVDAAQRGEGNSSLEDEVGDLLQAAVSLARHLRVDPETALRRANGRFEARFRAMEALAAQRGLALAKLDAPGLDSLWEDVKKGIQS